MNRGAYTAATGMMAQQRKLDVIANNLANVNTKGFKGDRLTFSDMMVRTMAEDGGNGAAVGILASGPTVENQTVDFTQGSLEQTGNPLDLGITGSAMFGVNTSEGVRYTRNGAFTLDANGSLITKSGEAVLDTEGRPIVGLKNAVQVERDGRIHEPGKSVTLGTIGLFNGNFTKDPNGKTFFVDPQARAATPDDNLAINSGTLEAANVEPISMMVQMIALQRGYEISQKMVQSQDESTAKLAETMA